MLLSTSERPPGPRAANTRQFVWLRHRHTIFPYLLLSPLLALLALVVAYPLAYEIDVSLRQEVLYIPQTPFVGLQNYARIPSSSQFWFVIRTTLIWTAGCMLFQFALDMGLALVFNRGCRAAVSFGRCS
jgi:multiple sugar transport system permease protein